MARSFAFLLVLDFEATCDDERPPQPQEVIEFPSVLLAKDTMQTVAEFESFVRPVHHPKLTPFCKRLTSIEQPDIDAAACFREVFARHQEWLRIQQVTAENTLMVTCGNWDLKTMLPAQSLVSGLLLEQIPPIYTRWHNIKRAFSKSVGGRRASSMTSMLEALGLPLVGTHHRGIDDCRNIAALCRALSVRGAEIDVTGSMRRPS